MVFLRVACLGSYPQPFRFQYMIIMVIGAHHEIKAPVPSLAFVLQLRKVNKGAEDGCCG